MSLGNSISQFEELRRTNLPVRPKKTHGWVLFCGDILAILIAWFVANKIFFWVPVYTLYVGANSIGVIEILSLERLVALLGVVILLARQGHYKDHIHYFFQLRSIFTACCLGLIGESLLRLYLERPTATLSLVIAWGLTTVTIMTVRVVASNIITSNKQFRQPVVVITDGQLGRHTKEAIQRKPRLGYREIGPDEFDGSVDWVSLSDSAINEGDQDALAKLYKLASQTPRDTLFLFAFDVFDQISVPNAVRRLESVKRPFGFVTSQTGIRLPHFKEFPLFGEDLILLLPDKQGPTLASRALKRLFDVVSSGLALILLIPLFAICAYLIRRDGGRAFFVQDRIGRDGKHFKFLKFRTMVEGAEAKLAEALANNPEAQAEWAAHQKLSKDPRITPVGKFLRKGSFDELPQLINVFRGQMSIIGPRPCFDNQVEQYGKRFASYLAMRPGITGLWQVSGRNHTTFEERAELEAWYVDNWSLWLDLFILVKTIPVVLLARGAS